MQQFLQGTAEDMEKEIAQLSQEGWRVVPGTQTVVKRWRPGLGQGSECVYSFVLEKREEL